MDKMSTSILAVRRESLPHLHYGFSRFDQHDLSSIERAGLWLGPRGLLEEDPAYLQIIPYIVLKSGYQVVTYRRTPRSSEGRLHGQYSLGVGGHIDFADIRTVDSVIHLDQTLHVASCREVAEEVGSLKIESRKWCGVLFNDREPVGRVHLGIVGLWQIAGAVVTAAEDHLDSVSMVDVADLHSMQLEAWSELLLPFVLDDH